MRQNLLMVAEVQQALRKLQLRHSCDSSTTLLMKTTRMKMTWRTMKNMWVARARIVVQDTSRRILIVSLPWCLQVCRQLEHEIPTTTLITPGEPCLLSTKNSNKIVLAPINQSSHLIITAIVKRNWPTKISTKFPRTAARHNNSNSNKQPRGRTKTRQVNQILDKNYNKLPLKKKNLSLRQPLQRIAIIKPQPQILGKDKGQRRRHTNSSNLCRLQQSKRKIPLIILIGKELKELPLDLNLDKLRSLSIRMLVSQREGEGPLREVMVQTRILKRLLAIVRRQQLRVPGSLYCLAILQFLQAMVVCRQTSLIPQIKIRPSWSSIAHLWTQ